MAQRALSRSLSLSLSAGGPWLAYGASLLRIDFHHPPTAEGSGHIPACPSKITANKVRASCLEMNEKKKKPVILTQIDQFHTKAVGVCGRTVSVENIA